MAGQAGRPAGSRAYIWRLAAAAAATIVAALVAATAAVMRAMCWRVPKIWSGRPQAGHSQSGGPRT